MEPINLICNKCKHSNPFLPGCKAFDQIPEEILSGKNKHKTPLPHQKNNITFEPAENKTIIL